MTGRPDEFRGEEDLDLRNLSWDEPKAWWDTWLRQAQATSASAWTVPASPDEAR